MSVQQSERQAPHQRHSPPNPKKPLTTFLRPLRGEITERRFATVDIETHEWVNPYAVGFYDGSEYTDFIGDACIEDAIAHILTPRYAGFWIYAHNGGSFDFLFFLRHLLTSKRFLGKYLIEITPIGSTLLRIQVAAKDKDFPSEKARNSRGQLKWTFVDSVRLMPIKLNDLAATFGLGAKVKTGMSYDDLAKVENRKVMRRYLKTDCTLLHEAVSTFQHTINNLGGQIGVTLPATAMDLFRRKFQDRDIATNRHFLACKDFGADTPKDRAAREGRCLGCLHEFMRQAYYGGRTEIFRMRFSSKDHPDHHLAYVYDINSHYPACMLEPMPVGEAIELQDLTEAQVYANARKLIGIVDAEVYIPEDCYFPPLPHPHKGKLIFPVGRFRGTWDTAELTLLARVGGRIEKTHKSTWFETAPVFARFVTHLYKFRDKTNPQWTAGMDYIAKILLNSLYGKFAMKSDRQKVVVSPKDIDGLTCIDMESDVWSEEIYVSPAYIVPQLSIHVTSLARAKLWEAGQKVLDQGGRLYYMDTDSLFVSGAKLETSGELGGMKLEATILRGEFVLPKLYLIETVEPSKKKKKEASIKVKAKGMGPGIKLGSDGTEDEFAGQLSEVEFRQLLQGGALQRHRLTKFKEGLRAFSKQALAFPRITASPKQIRTQYDKRRVLNDYDTRPILLTRDS
jgi:hypothetical protein